MRKPCEFGYTRFHFTEVSCQGVFGILEMVASCRCNMLQMFLSMMVRRISKSARFSCMNVCCSCCSTMFHMHQRAPWQIQNSAPDMLLTMCRWAMIINTNLLIPTASVLIHHTVNANNVPTVTNIPRRNLLGSPCGCFSLTDMFVLSSRSVRPLVRKN